MRRIDGCVYNRTKPEGRIKGGNCDQVNERRKTAMKCLLRYEWVKLLRACPSEGKGDGAECMEGSVL